MSRPLTGRAPLDPGAVAELDRMADAVAEMEPADDFDPFLWSRGERPSTVAGGFGQFIAERPHGLSHAAERAPRSAALDPRPLASRPLGALKRLGADCDARRGDPSYPVVYSAPAGGDTMAETMFMLVRASVPSDAVANVVYALREYSGDIGENGYRGDPDGWAPAGPVDCEGWRPLCGSSVRSYHQVGAPCNAPAGRPAPCPYNTEVNGDRSDCTCCDDCRDACGAEV